MIDTHAHLDALDDPAAAVARAREAGVTRIVTIGTDPSSWAKMLPIVDDDDEKQCSTTVPSNHCRRMETVSSSAARLWITTGSCARFASPSW